MEDIFGLHDGGLLDQTLRFVEANSDNMDAENGEEDTCCVLAGKSTAQRPLLKCTTVMQMLKEHLIDFKELFDQELTFQTKKNDQQFVEIIKLNLLISKKNSQIAAMKRKNSKLVTILHNLSIVNKNNNNKKMDTKK